MRLALLTVLAAALALPAAAANPHPSAFVLRQADVPAGFRVDRANTGVRTNAAEAKSDPRIPALFERWGRLTGYQIEFQRREQTISSRTDVFRSASGARQFLDWYDREVRKLGFKRLRRARAGVGAQGWQYRTELPAPATIVVWRFERVFAGVAGVGIPHERTLALVRIQQRRIATALR